MLCAFVSNAVYTGRLHFKLTSSHESVKHRANCFAIFPCDIDSFVDHESRDFLATFEVLKPSFFGVFDKPSFRYGFANFVAQDPIVRRIGCKFCKLFRKISFVG